MTFATLSIADRLRNGAKLLGQLWRSGQQCGSSWELACRCHEGLKSRFCKAKAQWVKMALEHGRDMVEDEFCGLIQTMTLSEFDATSMTITIDVPGVREFRVGPKGEIPAMELPKVFDSEEGASVVARVLDKFPGSKVVEDDHA